MPRRLIFLVLFFAGVGITPSAGAASRRCRVGCRAAIDQCHQQGTSRRRCKRLYLRACRRFGVVGCSLTPSTLPVPAGSTTTTLTSSSTTSTTLPGRLNVLLGRWTFTYTTGPTSTTQHYELTTVEPAQVGSYDVVRGTNLDHGNGVLAARIQDIAPGSSSPFEFILVDGQSSSTCLGFEFDVTSASARGEVFFLEGDCATETGAGAEPFTGIRY